MKLIINTIIAGVWLASASLASASEAQLISQPLECNSQTNETNASIQVAGQVLCCCTNALGQQCCNWASFCGGFVPGCFCAGRSSDPADKDIQHAELSS